jgi:hypothetical protein
LRASSFYANSGRQKNHAGGRYERIIRDIILDLLNDEETRWGVLNWPPIPDLKLPSASQCEAANLAFIIRLRAFVDGFIQTGIDSSGIETPSSRKVRASVEESLWIGLWFANARETGLEEVGRH